MTRAALRAQAAELTIHEDGDTALDSFSNDSSQDDLSVLKEVTNLSNVQQTTMSPAKVVVSESNHENARQDSPKKHHDGPVYNNDLPTIEAHSSNSSATDMDSSQKEATPERPTMQSATTTVSQSLAEAAPNSTPALTKSENVATGSIARNPARTPRFDSTLDEPHNSVMDEQHDSFVQSIKSRTPGRVVEETDSHGEDSFVEKITSRTPRRTSRIEDSVEAMDALEDAIEQYSVELPSLDDLRIDSPIKDRHELQHTAKPQSNLKTLHVTSTKPTSREASKSPSSKIGPKATTRPKPTTKRPVPATSSAFHPHRALSAKDSLAKNSTQKTVVQSDGKDGKASMSFSSSPLKTQANTKKRTTSGPLSTSRPGFVPAKSTKAPTKSTFVLPGEIYAAKLKADREAKEEESEQPKQFKARPVPKARPSVIPRENKASQARMSIAAGGTIPPSKRVSSLDVPKVRNSINPGVKRASSVVPKASRVSSLEPKFAANVPRVASLTNKVGSLPKAPEVAPVLKKASGKEVFARSKVELEKQDNEKRQKEEAARKARAEAAERGRLASREWAEKKAKMAAAQKTAAK